MRISIGTRLFLSMLAASVIVGAAALEFVRWKFFDNFAASSSNADRDRLAVLESALVEQYRAHHDWSFLPAAGESRHRWLSEQLLRVDATRQPTSLEHRIGLFDDQHVLLSGVSSRKFLVALASIDRVERPLRVDGAIVGYLVLAQPQNPADGLAVAFLIDQQRNVLMIFALSIALSAVAAALLALRVRRPIRQLADGARLLAGAQYQTRMHLQRRDELGDLAGVFNQLAQKLEQTEQARRQWVADTSHELRTPLSVLRGQLEALQDGIRTATPENLAMMLRQVAALSRLVERLFELAKADVGQPKIESAPVEMWPVIREVFEDFAGKFAAAGLVAKLGDAPVVSVAQCDVTRMREVFTNLFENCVRYTHRGGEVAVSAAHDGRELCVVIDDSAPGVPEAALVRLGERFFRLSSSEVGGMGVGLALSKLLVEAQAGSILFAPSPLGGLRVTVVLPA